MCWAATQSNCLRESFRVDEVTIRTFKQEATHAHTHLTTTHLAIDHKAHNIRQVRLERRQCHIARPSPEREPALQHALRLGHVFWEGKSDFEKRRWLLLEVAVDCFAEDEIYAEYSMSVLVHGGLRRV